jgi:hypothetical protein
VPAFLTDTQGVTGHFAEKGRGESGSGRVWKITPMSVLDSFELRAELRWWKSCGGLFSVATPYDIVIFLGIVLLSVFSCALSIYPVVVHDIFFYEFHSASEIHISAEIPMALLKFDLFA